MKLKAWVYRKGGGDVWGREAWPGAAGKVMYACDHAGAALSLSSYNNMWLNWVQFPEISERIATLPVTNILCFIFIR